MFNTFSLPGFQCIDGLLLPEHLQLSVGRNSDSILPELFPTVEQYIPISLLLFLKLDYQSLFIDISLPWSDDNTSVQECRGILAARCASCNCMTYFSCAPLQSCRRLYRLQKNDWKRFPENFSYCHRSSPAKQHASGEYVIQRTKMEAVYLFTDSPLHKFCMM